MIPKLKNDWLSTYSANISVWIPAQAINFGYVRPMYQVLFANAVGLGWNSILSYKTYKKVSQDKSE